MYGECSGWHRGVAVECRIRDQEVAGSSLGRALRRKNSGQVSHTYVPLSSSSITWYWPKGGDARRLGR